MAPGTSGQQRADEDAQLAVVVLHARDAEAAAAGGADRLLLSTDPEQGHHSPDPATVSAVVRETDLPVWVALSRPDTPHEWEGDPALVVTAASFLELGATGLAYGFLDRDLEIDREGCAEMCAELDGARWMFHGFDAALDADRAWRDVMSLPGLESVVSAGSTRGITHGSEELISRCRHDRRVAGLLMAGGGLTPETVPWLVRVGVRRFAVGSAARPGGSWTRASVDADRVRSWRMLLDDAVARALGIPVD
ncbi:MAG: copper homeostasis protein CutC [Marmoricola sp.]|nr:copper homeostasis protein CutC [Marmoricola sp.]